MGPNQTRRVSEAQQAEWNTAKAASFQKLVKKFETPDIAVTLQDIHRVVRLAETDPAQAVQLISKKQNNVLAPSHPADAAKGLYNIGSRYRVVAEQAFAAILENTDPRSGTHALSLIETGAVKDPVSKIETSSASFRIDLIGYLAKEANWQNGWKKTLYTAAAVEALCRIRGPKAEHYIKDTVTKLPEFRDAAYAAFPDFAEKNRVQCIFLDFSNNKVGFFETIDALKALDDGHLAKHLLSYKGRTDYDHVLIEELAQLKSEDAAAAIYEIGLINEGVRLNALDALGSMRMEATTNGVNDVRNYDAHIQGLLKQTLNLELIEDMSAEGHQKFQAHFSSAVDAQIVPVSYRDTFSKAVHWLAEKAPLKAALDNLRKSEPT